MGATETAKADLDAAVQPVLTKLPHVNTVAGQAEGKLRDAAASFGWKWAVMAGGIAAGTIVTVLLAAWITVAWQRHQIEQLAEQRQALSDDIAQMQANVAALQKRGGRIKMSTCGERLCIEASRNQDEGHTDWHAPWETKDGTGTPLVIPRGYWSGR